MNPFLAAALQSAPETVVDPVGIEVAKRPSEIVREEAPVRYGLDNLGAIREAQDVERKLREARKLPKGDPNRIESHKGPFGVKGTLRDVLGTLGDALLINAGKSPIYKPQREKERLADAAAGMTSDPLGAVERLAAVPGGLNVAKEVQNHYENQLLRQQQQESLTQAREAAVNDRRLSKRKDGLTLAAQMLATGRVDPKAVVAALKDFGITEEDIDTLAGGDAGMTVSQQRRLPLEKERVDIARQNANANTKRANRPPAGRAQSRPSASNVDAEILNAVRNGTATPEERQIYRERLIRSSGRGIGNRGPSSGGKLRISKDGKIIQ